MHGLNTHNIKESLNRYLVVKLCLCILESTGMRVSESEGCKYIGKALSTFSVFHNAASDAGPKKPRWHVLEGKLRSPTAFKQYWLAIVAAAQALQNLCIVARCVLMVQS